jgi:hypothetical protein
MMRPVTRPFEPLYARIYLDTVHLTADACCAVASA